MSAKFGLIGGGVMGEALLSRLVAQKIYLPQEVIVSEPQLQRRDFLVKQYGVSVTPENGVAFEATEVVLLAIKPQVFEAVVANLTHGLIDRDRPPIVLSILAGVPLQKLEAAFPEYPVVRAMPNTPATVGAGMTAIAPG
ncbi:MAG TPA: NAD(P)-binding domain-containing protein, partial [Candidatus Obscuribacterales bacterium]